MTTEAPTLEQKTEVIPTPEPTEAPQPYTSEYDLRYEHCIAYYIVGKLILDGALDPTNFNFDRDLKGTPFIVNSIAEAILKGLHEFGWRAGGVAELIDLAEYGERYKERRGDAE